MNGHYIKYSKYSFAFGLNSDFFYYFNGKTIDEKYALYNSQSNYLKNLKNLSDHIVLLLTDLQIDMIEKSLSNYFYGNLNQFKI